MNTQKRENVQTNSSITAFAIEQAQIADLEIIISILEEAAHWLTSRGIDQWEPEKFRRPAFYQRISDQIRHGLVYLAKLDGTPAGTITLQPDDSFDRMLWEPIARPEDASYVHSLATHRAAAGVGVGRAMLHWAEQHVAAAHKPYLRLDCAADNDALCAYYERAGFTTRGNFQGKGWMARRYEKAIARNHPFLSN